MKKTAIIAFGTAILMAACTTTKTVISQPEAPKAEETTPEVSLPTVTPSTEFISITEAISLLDNPQQTAELAKKYGYKIINDYAVYRLDAYKPMMYKKCRPVRTAFFITYRLFNAPVGTYPKSIQLRNGKALLLWQFRQLTIPDEPNG